MQTQPQTSKQYFTSLKIIHIAMLMGQMMMLLMFYFIVQSNGEGISPNEEGDNFAFILKAIASFLVVSCVLLSQLIPKTQLKTIRKMASLKQKLKDYRALQIVKYALLEGAAMATLVFYFITGELFFLMLVLPLVLVFFFERPSQFKTISDLELKKDDRTLIDNPDAIVC